MEKSYQIPSGNKSVTVNAPVIARLQFVEPSPDSGWIGWLTQREVTGESGLVLRRIGGIALIVLGIPVGIFGLLCFPGLLFWILGPVGLALIGQGILLMFSKRSKDPQETFKKLYKEALFNAEGNVVFSDQIFKSPDQVKKRILEMCPIENMELNDAELIGFMNKFEETIRAAFRQYGGPDALPCNYGVSVDSDTLVLGNQGPLTFVQGVINVMRQNGDYVQIIEVQVTMNLVNVGGYHMPVNLVPRVLEGAVSQSFSAECPTAWPSPVLNEASQ